VAVHAEERAILAALADGIQLGPGWELLHVRVVNGKAVPSGPPSCVKCSRLILESGISTMWLLHTEGLVAYAAERFHELSLAFHNLPTTRRA
jgi:deoxycytidylate deaminase